MKNILLISWVIETILRFTLGFFLQIKYKEEYEKTKGKATETKDSRLLHSLKVAKMSSEVNYFSYSKGVFHNYKSSNITMPSITVTALTVRNYWERLAQLVSFTIC